MSKNNAKGLTTLRQRVRRYIRDNFEAEVAAYKENPDEGESEEGNNCIAWFPLGREKWESIFQSGKSQGILNRVEKSGKSQGILNRVESQGILQKKNTEKIEKNYILGKILESEEKL